jgi:nucleoside-diphosphate-sugar epimerase
MVREMGNSKRQVIVPYGLAYVVCALMEMWAKLRRAKQMPYLTISSLENLNIEMNLDESKAKTELGWEAGVSLEDGIKQLVQWWRSNDK